MRRCAPHDTLTVWVTGATQARAIFLNEKVDPFDADLTDEIRDKCWLDGCVCMCVCDVIPLHMPIVSHCCTRSASCDGVITQIVPGVTF